MTDSLEDHFEKIIEKVKEFEYLKNYRIKLESKLFGGYAYSVKASKYPEDLAFTAGYNWGLISVVTPCVILTNYIIGIPGIPLNSLFKTLVVLYVLRVLYVRLGVHKISESDYDFVIESNKDNLAHELGHIHLHREKLSNIESKGFINGLNYFFNLNAKWDIEVENFLEKFGLHAYGRFHMPMLRYFDKVGDVYRFLKII